MVKTPAALIGDEEIWVKAGSVHFNTGLKNTLSLDTARVYTACVSITLWTNNELALAFNLEKGLLLGVWNRQGIENVI